MTGPEALDAPFWEAAREGRLVVQRCTACGQAFWPAIARCGDCDGGPLEWVDVPPRGRIWSYAVYHRVFDPRLDVAAPYAVVAVELDAGVCLPGRFVGALDALEIGVPVTATFAELGATTAPVWNTTQEV